MQDRAQYEARVRSDLKEFASIVGKPQADLVALLGSYQSGRAPANRSTWNSWLHHPAQLSSIAYLKVVDVIREAHVEAEKLRPPMDPQRLEDRVNRLTTAPPGTPT